ncbi:MAG: IS110 family transposase [Hymenobacter sp.]
MGIDIAKDTLRGLLRPYSTLSQQLHFGKETTFDNTAGRLCGLAQPGRPSNRLAAAPLLVRGGGHGCLLRRAGLFSSRQPTVAERLAAQQGEALCPAAPNSRARPTNWMRACSAAWAWNGPCRPGSRPRPPCASCAPWPASGKVLMRQGARLKTQRHAYQHSYQPDSRTLARLAAQPATAGQQAQSAWTRTWPTLLEAEPELARKLAHLTSVPGIGLTTAIVVVAETNGFVLIENERQLASYAGLDVVQRQSGLSAQATRISRRGNVRLRTGPLPAGGEQLTLQPAANGLLCSLAGPPAQRQAGRDCRHAQTARCSATRSGKMIAPTTRTTTRRTWLKKK